jgi:hypothetical protein
MTTYRERSAKEFALIQRVWERYLSDFDYKLSTDLADQVFYQLLTVLGGGSRQEIRDTIEEAKWINRELQP